MKKEQSVVKSSKAPIIKIGMQFGDGEITLKHAGQELISFHARIALKQEEKDFDIIEGKARISAAGYIKLNRIAGINIISPPTIFYDGQEKPNPYPILTQEDAVIKAFVLRRMGIGYSPTGNLVVIDKTLYFNLATYFQQVLVRMANELPAVVKMGVKYMCPFMPMEPVSKGDNGEYYCLDRANNKTYLFKSVEEGAGLWIDLSHIEIIKAFKEHTQRQKFGERIAQTIIDRNILKSHPSIGVQTVNPKNGVAFVDVYGWRHNLGQEQFNTLVHRILRGEQIEGVQIERTEESVNVEEVEEVEADEVENGEEIHQGEKLESKSSLFDQEEEDRAIRNNMEALAKQKNIDLEVHCRALYGKNASYNKLTGIKLLEFYEHVKKIK